jgi:predicted kinase
MAPEQQPTLVVLRGNSAAGKTTVAKAVRTAYGRGLAWVSQDIMRRAVLREPDRPDMLNVGLIDLVTRYCLGNGYHVVLDGILNSARYGEMLAGLHADFGGHFFYFDVSLAETLRRHAGRPLASEVTEADLVRWYQPADLLCNVPERVIAEQSTLAQTVELVMAEASLVPSAEEPTTQAASQPSPRKSAASLARSGVPRPVAGLKIVPGPPPV